ncbi:MAG: hypothetical protein KF862_01350 [Chitinophagaceae bacterium]|nr:hypothetical protein [Chitinophagaceae bacterium]
MQKIILLFAVVGLLGCHISETKIASRAQPQDPLIIGPGGGGATFIPTFSPANPLHFIVRCDMTGSYLTKNGGTSYQQFNFANGASGYAFHPKDSNTIYIGSATLNRSADGGKTWEVVFPGKEDIIQETYSGDHANYTIEVKETSLYDTASGSIHNIRIDPVTTGGLYFSMGRYFFYSFDNGRKWAKEDCKKRIDFIYAGNTTGNEVYIFTPEALYRFDKNTGIMHWKDYPAAMIPSFSFTGGVKKGTDSVIFYSIHHDTKREVNGEFGYSEIWKSGDSGNAWEQVSDTVITNASAGIKPSYSMISCAEQDAASVYVVTNRYQEKSDTTLKYWYGALKSADAGKSWQWCWKGGGGSGKYGVKDGNDAVNLSDAWVKKAFGGEYIRLMDVGVYPADGNTAIVTDWYRTMKTTDGGNTWQQVYSNSHPDGSFGSRGLEVTTAYGVHFDPFDSNHMAISYTDIGYHHSFDGGTTWHRSTEGVPVEWINTCYWVVFDPAVKNKLWSAWSGMHDFPRGKMTRDPLWKKRARGGICVSEDGGKTWKPVYEGMGMDAPATCLVLDTASPAGNRTLYAAVYNKGVFKSTDDGKTWTLKNNGIEDNTCAFELTLSAKRELFLTVSATPQHTNGKRGRAFYSGAVYKSTDGATTWTKLQVTDGLLFPNGIECDPLNPDRIYLGCWADIDLSDLVGGETARNTGGNEKLKMPGGIFLSEDGGKTWRQVFDDKQYVYDIVADARIPGRLYLNTFNKAAYRSDDSGNTWKKIKGYDFHWGQRPALDPRDKEKIFLTTFGSGVWWGRPETEQ